MPNTGLRASGLEGKRRTQSVPPSCSRETEQDEVNNEIV